VRQMICCCNKVLERLIDASICRCCCFHILLCNGS
jgi:hypothetical protein